MTSLPQSHASRQLSAADCVRMICAAKARDLMNDGTWHLIQHKTRKRHTVRFAIDAQDYAKRIPGPRELLLPWPYSIETLRKRFRTLVHAAQIRPGTFKWLRRSAGTYYEKVHPDAGHRLLGNTRDVFDANYHDRTITESIALQAPALE